MRRRFRSSRADTTKSRGCYCIGFWADQLIVCGGRRDADKQSENKNQLNLGRRTKTEN